MQSTSQTHRLVTMVDEFLSAHVAATFITMIICVCLLLYIILWEQEEWINDVLLSMMTIFWLLLSMFALVVELVIPARVNTSVSIICALD